MWFWFFMALWVCILTMVALFVLVDARNAFDGDPATATLSGYIKRWRRRSRWHTAVLAGLICSLALIPVYLFLHLVLEAV